MTTDAYCDVAVIGAGNAGMSAAVSAAEHGARVVVLERAPQDLRGGNTYFTADLRFPWRSVDELAPLVPGLSEREINDMRERATPYSQDAFYDDVMRVTEGRCDPDLLQLLVTEAYPTMRWMASKGHTWTPTYAAPGFSMAVSLNGGGVRLSDHWFEVAASMGIDVRYNHRAMELVRNAKGRVSAVRVLTPGGLVTLHAKAVILASGGFEANPAMRAAYLGPGWDMVKIRGVPFNTGDGLRMAWDIGAVPHGHLSACHATPQDMNRPAFSLRVGVHSDEYQRYVYPYSVMVNINGERFVDEGADMRPYTYAKTGAAIMRQPRGVAFQIIDRKCAHLLHGGYERGTRAQADTLAELAQRLDIDVPTFVRTIEEYNKAVQPGAFDPMGKDGKRTAGLAIPKSNWAQAIDEPPFQGFPVICGITFTFGGLRVNTRAQVICTYDDPIPGLYACGEIVGGLWYVNYPGGSGMTQGATFGRIAGREAGRLAGQAG